MIELKRSNDGFLKTFKPEVALKALSLSEAQKGREQIYWSLPDDSDHKIDKDGLFVLKAKKPIEKIPKAKKVDALEPKEKD